MIGGPVTAIPTMVLFWTIFKKRVFALYLFVCLAGTILISYGFQLTVFAPGVDTGNELLRGVSRLSGTPSVSLTKSDSNVRMVLDPGGTGVVASFRNDLDDRGGVLFDGGYGRFLGDAPDLNDNRRYILNLAGWLAENSSSPAKTHILVYDVSAGERSILSSGTLADLSREGFMIRILRRNNSADLSPTLLADCGQLWLFSGDGDGLSAAEQRAVLQFNREGKSMLLVPGAGGAGTGSMTGINRISSTFGVTFSDKNRQNGDIATGGASRLFAGASELLGRFLKLAHKA
jgi:hypothetical protein